jgi:hypothetical protein
MKLFNLAILILVTQAAWSQTDHKQLKVVKVGPQKENCIEIPGSFSNEMIYKSKSLNKLQSKKITRVELIYTRFRENPDFDQVRLNEDRMRRLNQLLPKITNDHPEIVWIEQTGATTREEAIKYFHGFRIYAAEKSDIPLSNEDKKSTSMFDVDNSIGGNFSLPGGTQIQIPADAVIFEDGTKVTGVYNFSYREYHNYADIIFYKTPSPYPDETGYYQFNNSAGMYEMRGLKDGKFLQFQKDILVDFKAVK